MMKILLWPLLLMMMSCTPDIAAKPASYSLKLTDKSKVLYVYVVSGVKHSAYGENGRLQTDANVPASWDTSLELESYQFVNASEKTDRYYYLDSSKFLHSTFDGIAVTQLTNFPVANGPLKT